MLARFGAVWLAAVLLVTGQSAQEAATAGATEKSQATVTICAFCRAPISGADFCPRCGRLARIVSTSSEHRFWNDVPYVLAFPPQGNAPEIETEFSPQGLVHESVRYASGDRYEMKVEKKGPVISGKVGWLKGGKETDYSAEMEDGFDPDGHLVTRQVTGKLNGSPDMFLYRRLDYKYAGGRLDRIEFTTSFYRGPSDWKKSPAAWLRHSAGEIELQRDGEGALIKIETTVRDGKRSLRGEPEYGERHLLVEFVVRDGGQVARVTKDQE